MKLFFSLSSIPRTYYVFAGGVLIHLLTSSIFREAVSQTTKKSLGEEGASAISKVIARKNQAAARNRPSVRLYMQLVNGRFYRIPSLVFFYCHRVVTLINLYHRFGRMFAKDKAGTTMRLEGKPLRGRLQGQVKKIRPLCGVEPLPNDLISTIWCSTAKRYFLLSVIHTFALFCKAVILIYFSLLFFAKRFPVTE